jgi:hypothetical protein
LAGEASASGRTTGAPGSARAAPQPEKSALDQLKELGELKQQGVLTDEEFAAQKAKILGA